jgi:hypothetical protein
VTGCQVTPADITHWQRTQKGPGKIVRVLLEDRFSTELRVDAALALVELDRADVDGVQQLGLVIDRLATDDPEALAAIAAGATPDLVEKLQAPEAEAEGAEAEEATGAAPSPAEVRAKDAAFLVAEHAPADARAKLGHALLDWFAADYARRAMVGNVSADQAAAAFGDEGAKMLVQAMNERLPKELLPRMAERAAELGGAETKASAAARVIAIERAMEGQGFLDWLKDQIRTALTRDGHAPEEARVEAAASLNRERFINDGALPAMKFLSSEAAVADRLLEIAASTPPAGLEGDLREAFDARRARALAALEGQAKPAHVARLLPLALSSDVPLPVRDLAFNRLGDTGSRDAIAPMWALVEAVPAPGAPREEVEMARLLRMKAGELVLELGGPSIVDELLRRLPRARDAAFEADELEVYAGQMSEMSEPPTDAMRRELASHVWWRRVLAIFYFQRAGSASDASALDELGSDATSTVGEGWSRGESPRDTVGKVATAAAAAMRERLARAEQAVAEAGER